MNAFHSFSLGLVALTALTLSACTINNTTNEAGGGSAGAAGAAAGSAGAAGTAGTAGAGGQAGTAGSGGSGGGGQVIPEGPPGAVGNACKTDGTCDPNLVCSATKYCQPAATQLPSQIKQAVPPPDSGKVPSSSPIFLFADAKYANVKIQVQAYLETGNSDITTKTVFTKLTSGADKDIYVISSTEGFPLGSSIVVTLSGDIVGKLVFNIDHKSPAFADGQLGFEGATAATGNFAPLPTGWTGFGDVAVELAASGSMKPTEGTKMAVMTTGAAVGGTAIGGTSSLLVSGPITMGPSPGLSFDYNFQSSEFDDYCNSSYDDTFLAVLVGPKGAVAKVVNSVNLVCKDATQVVATFPGMPDGGDAAYKETGVKQFSIAGDVGSPAVVAFVVTDVGDAALSSVVGIDALKIVK